MCQSVKLFRKDKFKMERLERRCGGLGAFMSSQRPITLDEACALRLLLFGDLNMTFGAEWSKQSFHFRRNQPLSYGIFQKKAGPCGVLAAVQAYVLKELLFGASHVALKDGILKPTLSEKSVALSLAIKSILWQAGGWRRAIVAVKEKKIALKNNLFKDDGILEHVYLKYFDCETCLLEYLFNFASEMMDDDKGHCILFLYSLIMSHGIDITKKEMDYSDCSLIGRDGYCSQEVINLILVGKAVSNLFDGEIELNSGGPEISVHHGIPNRSQIGLLSLLDYQNNCPVGNYYKNPVNPIFLLLYDTHFTVLFGTSKRILNCSKPDESFTLHHYDSLQRNKAQTSFNIKLREENDVSTRELYESPIVKCIYTKWPHASVTLMEDRNIDEESSSSNLNL